jgi:chromate transporter
LKNREDLKPMGPTFWQITAYFLKLGATGFGGPVALANYMRKDLVERYRWLDGREYDEGLAIATACPGPLAYQLGVYCGYVTRGLAGALSVAMAFALGPLLIVCAIAALYVRFGSTWQLRALFYGIGPVVVALIFKSCWDLGRKTLRSERVAWTFAIVAGVVTVLIQKELTAIFLVAGALGIFLFAPRHETNEAKPDAAAPKSSPSVMMPAILPMALPTVASSKIFLFFLKTGFLVFGSGLVVVPFLKAYVVDQYHWLDNRTFLDAVAVGIVSPGPVVITATFVGYVLDNIWGALAATAGIFLPSLVFVIFGTPILRRYRGHRLVQGFIRGVTAAVVGVLVGTSLLVARSTVIDLISAILLIASLALLFSKWKIPEQALIGAGAVIGLSLAPFVHP